MAVPPPAQRVDRVRVAFVVRVAFADLVAFLVAFFAPAFLAPAFLAPAFRAPALRAPAVRAPDFAAGLRRLRRLAGGRLLRRRLAGAPGGGDVGDSPLEPLDIGLGGEAEAGHLLANLGADGIDEALTVAAAAVDQLVDDGLGLFRLHLAGPHEVADQILGPRLGHRREGHAGVEEALKEIVLRHGGNDTTAPVRVHGRGPGTVDSRPPAPDTVRGGAAPPRRQPGLAAASRHVADHRRLRGGVLLLATDAVRGHGQRRPVRPALRGHPLRGPGEPPADKSRGRGHLQPGRHQRLQHRPRDKRRRSIPARTSGSQS